MGCIEAQLEKAAREIAAADADPSRNKPVWSPSTQMRIAKQIDAAELRIASIAKHVDAAELRAEKAILKLPPATKPADPITAHRPLTSQDEKAISASNVAKATASKVSLAKSAEPAPSASFVSVRRPASAAAPSGTAAAGAAASLARPAGAGTEASRRITSASPASNAALPIGSIALEWRTAAGAVTGADAAAVGRDVPLKFAGAAGDVKMAQAIDAKRPAAAAAAPPAQAMAECMVCGELIDNGIRAMHQRDCAIRGAREAAARRDSDPKVEADERLAVTLSRRQQPLEPCQRRAIEHVTAIAQALSDAKLPTLTARAAALGFGHAEVTTALRFIRLKAPLVIHIFAERVLSLLLADTHYRSQFETKRSGGTLCEVTRAAWEDELFGQAYQAAKPFDRPKYGSCNIVNDPGGIKCCHATYGDSYLVMAHNVRLRTTFTSSDSGILAHHNLAQKQPSKDRLATCEHYAHVLNEYSDDELKSVLLVANNREACLDSALLSTYKEAQVNITSPPT